MHINLKSISIESNSFQALVHQLEMGREFLDIWDNKWKTGPRTQGSGRALRIREAICLDLYHTAGEWQSVGTTTMTSPWWMKLNTLKKRKWPNSSFCILHTLKVKVAQSCLCDPMNYTVLGILQARILEWAAYPFSKESSQTRDWTQISYIVGGFFTSWATRKDQEYWSGIAYLFSRGSSLPRNQTGVSCIAGRFLTNWAVRETQGKEPHRNSPVAAFGIWIVQVPWRKAWKANWMWELEQLGSLVQEVGGVSMK